MLRIGTCTKRCLTPVLLLCCGFLIVGSVILARQRSNPVRIMPLGDSITYDNRVGDPRPVGLRVAYRQYLWLMLQDGGFDVDFVGSVIAGQDAVPPFDTDNEGHPGWTAGQTATSVYNFLVNHPADVVLLHIGTNGLITSPADVESTLNEIDRFESDLWQSSHCLIWHSLSTVCLTAATTSQFNVNVQAMAQARIDVQHDKIVIVDMENGAGIDYRIDTQGVNGDMYDDLHPNFKGYEKMAAKWYSQLRPLLLSKDCPSKMTHYWKLDETSGQALSDFYGTAPRTCTSCPTPAPGRVNGGQLFGDSSQVLVAADGSLDWGSTASFSVECWLKKTTGFGGNEVLVGRFGENGLGSWWLGVNSDGRARFHLSDSSGTGDVYGISPMSLNQWHHLVATRDGTVGINRIYLDGALQGTLTKTFAQGFTSAADMTVGWLDESPYFHFSGIIDEVATYDTVLLSVQVVGHYENGLAGLGYCDGQAFAPNITSTPVTSIKEAKPYSYTVQATGNPAPIFRLANSPTGMSIDTVTGLIVWMPMIVGYFNVTAIAVNAVGADTQSFVIAVIQAPACPSGMSHYWKLR